MKVSKLMIGLISIACISISNVNAQQSNSVVDPMAQTAPVADKIQQPSAIAANMGQTNVEVKPIEQAAHTDCTENAHTPESAKASGEGIKEKSNSVLCAIGASDEELRKIEEKKREELIKKTHEELRGVLATLTNSINEAKFENLLPVLSKNIEATPINSEYLKGPDAVLKYFQKWFGEGKKLKS